MPKAKLTVERRANPRFSVKIPVKYRLEQDQEVLKKFADWRQNAFTLDVSLGGMKISVDHPLMLGDVLEFDIYLLEKSDAVKVYAYVVRADPISAGLKFLMMKDGEREVLKNFLK